MKKIGIIICSLFIFFNSNAQIKVSDKAIIKTPTVQCDKCKDKIEFFISKNYGVTSVKVDLKKKITTVTWLVDRTDIETIRGNIANLGYVADNVEADPISYKRLPKCCKIPDSTTKLPSKLKKN